MDDKDKQDILNRVNDFKDVLYDDLNKFIAESFDIHSESLSSGAEMSMTEMCGLIDAAANVALSVALKNILILSAYFNDAEIGRQLLKDASVYYENEIKDLGSLRDSITKTLTETLH